MNNESKDSLALVKQRLRSTGSYTGALLLSLPVVPLVATIISVMAYVTMGQGFAIPGGIMLSGPFIPLLIGIIPAFLLWLFLSFIQRNASWICGTGYVHLWGMMNKAEEALIEVQPREAIICEAADDEMRLNNSRVQNSEEWVNKLRLAIQNLDSLVPASSAIDYLKPAKSVPLVQSVSGTQAPTPAVTTSVAVA